MAVQMWNYVSRRTLSRPQHDIPIDGEMNIQHIALRENQKYTIYHCNDSAMSQRMEITVTSVLIAPVFHPSFAGSTCGNHRIGSYKRFRKRGEFHLDIKAKGTLIVPGWGHLLVDHEAFGNFSCSATLNIAGTIVEIRTLVEANLNPNFTAHDTILSFTSAWNEMPGQEGIPVFPDVPTSHAVIERIREKSTSSAR